jgi:hypothetical protein
MSSQVITPNTAAAILARIRYYSQMRELELRAPGGRYGLLELKKEENS